MDQLTETLLRALLESGKITGTDVVQLDDAMNKRKALENKYEAHIVQREREGRKPIWIIKIEGKQYQGSTKERLYEKLYALDYGNQNASMEDLFPDWMIWRRDNTPVSPRTLKNVKAEWEILKDEPLVEIPIRKVCAADLIEMYRRWTRNRSMTAKRFNNLKSIINGLFGYANQIGIEVSNPNHDINMRQFPMKAVNNDYNVYTQEDRKAIL